MWYQRKQPSNQAEKKYHNEYDSLKHWFSNFVVYQNHLESLLNYRLWG